MTPRFSIIIPVYNVAPYLRECLDSVLSQTCADWEAICVDDGSTDGSAAILDEVAIQDRRIRVIHKPNGGVGSARNRGLEEAKGDWILFLDGDDVWHPDLLDTCQGLIGGHPKAQIVRFTRRMFDDGSPAVWKDDSKDEIVGVRNLEVGLVGDDMRYSFVCNCCHRSVIPAHGFKNYVRGEDLLFRAECLAAATTMVTTSRCLYAYRTRLGSAMRSPMTERKLMDRIGYSLDWLSVLDRRPVDVVIYNRIAKNLTEAYVHDALGLTHKEQGRLFAAWHAMLPCLLGAKKVGGWYRLVARVCNCLRWRWTAIVLCEVPVRGKRLKRRLLRRKSGN